MTVEIIQAYDAGANQAPMKHCDGLTPDSLRKWGEALNEEMPRSIGEALIQFADAWVSELAAIPDIHVQEAALVGDNMILTQQLAECERERDELMDTIRQIGWDIAHIDAAIAKVEKGKP